MTDNINPIKAARTAAGYTQQQLSDLLDIPLMTLSQWETGKRNPPAYVKKNAFRGSEAPGNFKITHKKRGSADSRASLAWGRCGDVTSLFEVILLYI